jgi:hypothetical protein
MNQHRYRLAQSFCPVGSVSLRAERKWCLLCSELDANKELYVGYGCGLQGSS